MVIGPPPPIHHLSTHLAVRDVGQTLQFLLRGLEARSRAGGHQFRSHELLDLVGLVFQKAAEVGETDVVAHQVEHHRKPLPVTGRRTSKEDERLKQTPSFNTGKNKNKRLKISQNTPRKHVNALGWALQFQSTIDKFLHCKTTAAIHIKQGEDNPCVRDVDIQAGEEGLDPGILQLNTKLFKRNEPVPFWIIKEFKSCLQS